MRASSYWTDRRTIRNYKSEKIPAELLYNLLERAAHAPTTGNMQLYSVVVTTSDEEKQALAPFHFNQPQVTGAAAVLTFCADFNRMVKWCKNRKADPGYDNFQSFIAAAMDTIAVAQQFNTLAELEGLGCCWLGTTTYNAPQIAEFLQLPELVVPMITLTVGYPADEGVEVGRLPVEAIVHEGKYKDYDAAAIDRFYSEKESRQDSARFINECEKETLAQVFTDVRYPRSNNETFSRIFLDFLRQSGFLK